VRACVLPYLSARKFTYIVFCLHFLQQVAGGDSSDDGDDDNDEDDGAAQRGAAAAAAPAQGEAAGAGPSNRRRPAGAAPAAASAQDQQRKKKQRVEQDPTEVLPRANLTQAQRKAAAEKRKRERQAAEDALPVYFVRRLGRKAIREAVNVMVLTTEFGKKYKCLWVYR
jgi:hypothetical protein